jgi:hypothetical protein
MDRSGSRFKNSVENLRITSSVNRVTVDRFNKCIFQPTGCGWVLSDFESVLKPNVGVLEFGHGVLPQKRLIKRVDGRDLALAPCTDFKILATRHYQRIDLRTKNSTRSVQIAGICQG